MKAAISEESFDQVFSKLESALDWIVFLTNDNEADRHQIEPDHLKRAVQFIGPDEYKEEILIERNLNDLCGYPICLNEPKSIKKKTIITPRRNFNQSSYPQQPIGSSSRAAPVSETPGISHQEARFCSLECQNRSDYYLNCVLKNSSLRSRNNACIIDSNDDGKEYNKIILLEELVQDDRIEKSGADPFVTSHVPYQDQTMKAQHDFLEPLLTQFQSLNTTKWIDKNRNPIFSSIQIIEHPPQSSLSSSQTSIPSAPHPSNPQDPEQRFLNFPSSSRTSAISPTKAAQDRNPIHELSASLAEVLTSEAIRSNLNPHRSLASKPRTQSRNDGDESLASASKAEVPEAGLFEAEIIYNVGSIEDQSAIDEAMALRDQLELQSI